MIIVVYLRCARAGLLQWCGGPAGWQNTDHASAHPVWAAHYPAADWLPLLEGSVLQWVSGWKPQTENGMLIDRLRPPPPSLHLHYHTVTLCCCVFLNSLSTQCCSSLKRHWARMEWLLAMNLLSQRSLTKSVHRAGEDPARQLCNCYLLRLVWWVHLKYWIKAHWAAHFQAYIGLYGL